MERKAINRLFLAIILIHLIVVCILVKTSFMTDMGIITNLILSESMIMVPGLIYLLIYSANKKKAINIQMQSETETESICERLGFKKIKMSTFFMLILFTFMIMPLTTLLNAITMLFVDNTVLFMSGQVLTQPFIVMLFMVAMFGPFCEEFVFRGIIYGGYRKEGSLFSAVILSGLLFGLMHMNLNQACYAFVIGIAFALLVEATGSIFSSILCHFVFNAQSVCIMYMANYFMPQIYEEGSELAQSSTEELYITISVYIVIAAITTAIAYCILSWIAKNEGRTEQLKKALPSKTRKGKNLWSIALVAGIVLSVAYMAFEIVLTRLIS